MTAKVLEQLQATLGRDLAAFLPELILCAAIVLLLLFRLLRLFDRVHLGWAALVFTVVALALSCLQWVIFHTIVPAASTRTADAQAIDLFNGMLIFDRFSIFIKIFLYGFTVLVALLALLSRIRPRL